MKLQKSLFWGKTGYTLFELLVAISIIGILAAIATVSFSNAQKKARDARRMEDMKNVQNAAELYYSQNGAVYPTTKDNISAWGGTLSAFPVDPRGSAATQQYRYSTGSPYNYYCACAWTEGSVGNYNSTNCDTVVTNGQWFCVKNQQ